MIRKEKVNFALVGLGMVGPAHGQALSELASEGSHACLKLVCDLDSGRAKAAAEHFGCAWTSDIREVVSDPEIDVVDVTAPQFTHCSLGTLAARGGKHVIVEKPMEVSVERAEELMRVCRDAGVKLGVIFQGRFKKGRQLLRQALREGRLGRLLLGDAYVKWYRSQDYYDSCAWRGTWAKEGGGALINQAIHTLDGLLESMGAVDSVSACCQTTFLHKIEVEDLTVAHVKFRNGALGCIEASTALKPGLPERLEIHGERGSVILEDGQVLRWDVEGMDGEEMRKLSEEPRGFNASDPMAFPITWHKRQLADFCEAILQEREPAVTGEDGLKALKLIKAVYQSSENNCIVQL